MKPLEVASTAAQGAAVDRTLTEDATAGAGPRARRRSELPVHRLAHFVLEEKLGEGGMGEVYRGRDTSLDREVAIKLLPERVAQNSSLRERFVREARAQARIRHPNVCHIYFIGEESGRLFFAMELVEGETLSQRLERGGKLDSDEALDIAIAIARGLQAAQKHGFIHRDIKPSNVMIEGDGTVKILDFGLVTVGPAETDDESGPVDTTRAVLGTPLYMSPEQARGDNVDFRTDIYSLGATLHQLVAGEPPFSGDSAEDLATAHASTPRPVIHKRSKAAKATRVIDELCDRMMAKDPGERFESYEQLITVLDRSSTKSSPPVRALPRWMAFVIDVVGVALIVGLVTTPIELIASSLTGLEPEDWFSDVLIGLALVSYHAFSYRLRGRTIGMAVLNLKLVASGNAERLSWRQLGRRFWWQWGATIIGVPLLVLGIVIPFESVATVFEALGAALAVFGFLRVLVLGVWAARTPRMRTRWDRKSSTEVIFATRR